MKIQALNFNNYKLNKINSFKTNPILFAGRTKKDSVEISQKEASERLIETYKNDERYYRQKASEIFDEKCELLNDDCTLFNLLKVIEFTSEQATNIVLNSQIKDKNKSINNLKKDLKDVLEIILPGFKMSDSTMQELAEQLRKVFYRADISPYLQQDEIADIVATKFKKIIKKTRVYSSYDECKKSN